MLANDRAWSAVVRCSAKCSDSLAVIDHIAARQQHSSVCGSCLARSRRTPASISSAISDLEWQLTQSRAYQRRPSLPPFASRQPRCRRWQGSPDAQIREAPPQDFESLGRQIRAPDRTGPVTLPPGRARLATEPLRDRIARSREHDGDGRWCALCSKRRRRRRQSRWHRPSAEQFRRRSAQSVRCALPPSDIRW